MHHKQSKKLKGASTLHLNLHELRYELIRADNIINHTCQLLGKDGTAELQYWLIEDGITTDHDPLFTKSRQQAMHRITPKRDYVIITFMLIIAFLVLAWCAERTDNDLLRAEQAQTAIGDHHGKSNH